VDLVDGRFDESTQWIQLEIGLDTTSNGD